MRTHLLILPLLLAACVPVLPPPGLPGPLPDGCGASALQSLVGQQALVLETMRFSQPVRIIEAGAPVTMDYLGNRINFALDPQNRIERVSCG